MRWTGKLRLCAEGAALLSVAFLLGAPAPGGFGLAAQTPTATTGADGFPPNTVIARFGIDPDALTAVGTSGELVAALRAHLTLDLAMPLDESLTVALRGHAGDPDGPAPVFHFVYCGLSHRIEGPGSLDDVPYAATLRESHPDDELCMDEKTWDEDVEWAKLVESLELGLSQSSRAFSRPSEPGALPLRVVGVHGADPFEGWEFLASLKGARLQLEPSPGFGSSTIAGWEKPAGFGYDVRALVIILEPAGSGSR